MAFWRSFVAPLDGARLHRCSSAFERWMDKGCYCVAGIFYGEEDTTICTQRGIDVWGWKYTAYIVISCGSFLVLLGSCIVQLYLSYSRGARPLQKAIHGFCLSATVLRMGYLLAESSLIHSATVASHHPFLEKVADTSFTSFFPLSTAAFLCICQHWLRLIYVIEDMSELPWYRNPLCVACLVLFGLEALHDCWYFMGSQPVFSTLYFMWLALVSVMVALVGVFIATRLYGRLRSWVDDTFRLFRKVLLCAAIVSVSTASYLVVSIYQALDGRFYAWSWLTCTALGRLLEIVYLMLIQCTVSSVRQPAVARRHTESSPSSSSGSFERPAPSMLEAWWIGSSHETC